MRSRDRKVALELQFRARLRGASETEEPPTARATTVNDEGPATLVAATPVDQVPTVREAIRAIHGMVGKKVMVGIRDIETGYTPVSTSGSLSAGEVTLGLLTGIGFLLGVRRALGTRRRQWIASAGVRISSRPTARSGIGTDAGSRSRREADPKMAASADIHTSSEHLTALDATFLELEQADPAAHMHIGGIMTFEGLPHGGAPSVEGVQRELGARLVALPRYRQRLSAPTSGGLSWPTWDFDRSFDISAHVRRARLPGRGTDADLREWAGEYFSTRLDRSRPLWELVVISGLEGGRWAMASKTHHCMVDGVGSVDSALMMLDAEPHPDTGPPESFSDPEPTDVPASLLRRLPGASLARLPMRAAGALLRVGRSGADLATHPAHARETLRRSRALASLLIRNELVAAPSSSINVPIGAKRRIETVEVPLERLKAIKATLGGTVNDAVLAAVAGGLRELLLARGEEPPSHGLRAMVPVNIRSASDHLALGNRITSLFVHLPVSEVDPRRRYALQMEEAEALKAGDQALGTSVVTDLTGHAPPILHALLARSLYATRLFNLTITNVPGPQFPLYAFGSKLLSVWPIVPLASDHSLGLAVFSYDGRVFFTVNGDLGSTADLDVLLRGMASAVDEMADLVA